MVDIRETLAVKALQEAERNLLVGVIAESAWDFSWGAPWVYGGPERTGVTLGLLADATGFRRQVIERHVMLEEVDVFEGVMKDIALDEYRVKAPAIDLVDIPRLLLRLKPGYLKKPEARARMYRLNHLARAVRRAIGRLPEVQEATIKFFEDMGVTVKDGAFVVVESEDEGTDGPSTVH